MIKRRFVENITDLNTLCQAVRALLRHEEYSKCEELVANAMSKSPHAPEPHNLYGVILEKQGLHPEAMKHFRAAWALEPSYFPARYNMDIAGSIDSKKDYAIDLSDCDKKALKFVS